jgi:hypothetical protein
MQALEWAIHEEVDIINISCTVSDESMKNKKLKGNLEDAIRTASNRSLIYCATADGGPEAIKSYPAGFDNAGAIAICTATQDGNTLDSAEMQNKPKWLLPGERLMVHAPKYLNPTGKETAGGSSSATALASGLASLILTLVRFSSYQEEDSDDEVDSHDWASDELSEQRLRGSFATLGGGASPQSLDLGRNNSAEGAVEIFRRATNMNEVFAKLCGTSKNSFVQPWTKLPEASKNWTIGEAKQQLRVIFDSLS